MPELVWITNGEETSEIRNYVVLFSDLPEALRRRLVANLPRRVYEDVMLGDGEEGMQGLVPTEEEEGDDEMEDEMAPDDVIDFIYRVCVPENDVTQKMPIRDRIAFNITIVGS